jgi:hypothetical protein
MIALIVMEILKVKVGYLFQMILCQVHTRHIKRTPNEVHENKCQLKGTPN